MPPLLRWHQGVRVGTRWFERTYRPREAARVNCRQQRRRGEGPARCNARSDHCRRGRRGSAYGRWRRHQRANARHQGPRGPVLYRSSRRSVAWSACQPARIRKTRRQKGGRQRTRFANRRQPSPQEVAATPASATATPCSSRPPRRTRTCSATASTTRATSSALAPRAMRQSALRAAPGTRLRPTARRASCVCRPAGARGSVARTLTVEEPPRAAPWCPATSRI